MRERTILHTSEEVTRFANTPNVISPLLFITTPHGTEYIYSNPSQIIAKLFDTGGVQIPHNSALFLFVRRPGEDFGSFMRKFVYAPYFDLTIGQQRDVRNAPAITQALGAVNLAAIRAKERYVVEFWVRSALAIDLNRAGTAFEIKVAEQN